MILISRSFPVDPCSHPIQIRAEKSKNALPLGTRANNSVIVSFLILNHQTGINPYGAQAAVKTIGRYGCATLVVERIEYYQIHRLGVSIKREGAWLPDDSLRASYVFVQYGGKPLMRLRRSSSFLADRSPSTFHNSNRKYSLPIAFSKNRPGKY